jgi:N-dimethylarginine dimethylaminohydrolase
MAITPLGKKDPASGKPVMLVGDPSMAVKILKDVKTNSPGKYKQYQNQIKDKVSGTSRNPLDTMMKEVGNDRELQEGFDALAKGFEKDGYKVDRVPYLGGTNLHNHPWFTYNNSVIDGDQVFIPNFDIPELDRAGNEKFEKYGYKPIPIDMTAISSMMGAINCITKVVERDYA